MRVEQMLMLKIFLSISTSLLIAWSFRYRFRPWQVVSGILLDSLLRLGLLQLLPLSTITLLPLLAFAVFSRLAWIDASTQRLPDRLTLPLLAAGSLHAYYYGHPDWLAALQGACVGFLLLYLLDKGWLAVKGQHAIGGGDMKLLAALGAWSGSSTLLLLLSFASVMAAGFGLVIGCHHQRAAVLPFGPFLIIAALLLRLLSYHWTPLLWV